MTPTPSTPASVEMRTSVLVYLVPFGASSCEFIATNLWKFPSMVEREMRVILADAALGRVAPRAAVAAVRNVRRVLAIIDPPVPPRFGWGIA